ncbi:1,4-beta-D-glucan cellobiohydrolase cel6c [Marasmius sp. AFHP31]|nr:1,4-beta-D-glucan cellobiohydrolase cel6c [Marasmius sp. AFHP31]
MKSILSLVVLATAVIATPLEARAPCTSPVTLSGNPFQGRTLHANARYRSLVNQAAGRITDSSLKAKAQKVGDVGTFLWLDTIASISQLEENLKNTNCNEIFGVVIYDLPGRDCAAKASNGELPVGAINRYKTEYIDVIANILKKYPNIAIAAVIEPDSLPNLVTNNHLASCQASASGYREGTSYALKTLNFPNVAMYLDAGHGGWLGWNEHTQKGADELANAYKNAGSPSSVRGFVTNVSGWNAWKKVPGEFENTADGQYNSGHDEDRFHTLFANALSRSGMPNHGLVDTGRNGRQGLRQEWGHWCNVDGAGFGIRPGTDTGNSITDAFVWVKPGGESDGTSDQSATRYDSFCGHSDAFKPSPEAGAWHQAYFEMLVKNANPAF